MVIKIYVINGFRVMLFKYIEIKKLDFNFIFYIEINFKWFGNVK